MRGEPRRVVERGGSRGTHEENTGPLEGIVAALPVLLAIRPTLLALRGGDGFPTNLFGSASNAPDAGLLLGNLS